MTNDEKRRLYLQYMVIVQRVSFSDRSKCEIRNCKKKPMYLVFLGSSPRLSTLFASCCRNHLSVICDRATKEGLQTIEEIVKRIELKEIEDAKKILREKK